MENLTDFYKASETLLKTALQDSWEENRGDIGAWLAILAKYEAEVIRNGETEHTRLTRKYLEAGTSSLIRTLKGRVEAKLVPVLESILRAIVGIAVAAAVQKMKGL